MSQRTGLKPGHGSSHSGIQELLCSLNSEHGKRWIGEQTDLLQHRGLIPVDALMRQLSVTEADDNNQRNFDTPMGRWPEPSFPHITEYDFRIQEGAERCRGASTRKRR